MSVTETVAPVKFTPEVRGLVGRDDDGLWYVKMYGMTRDQMWATVDALRQLEPDE